MQTDRLNAQQLKAMALLRKQEEKLHRALAAMDSLAAGQMPLLKQAKAESSRIPYLPRLDSLHTLIGFLSQGEGQRLTQVAAQAGELQQLLANSEALQQSLQRQQQALEALLSRYTTVPRALQDAVAKYRMQAANYKAQAQAWKDMVNQPEKLEQEALRMLRKLPAFNDFMGRNGQLAQLFGAPGSAGGAGGISGAALAGLQTRQGVMQQLQQRLGGITTDPSGATTPAAFVQQQLQGGMAQLQQAQQQARSYVQALANGAAGNTQLTEAQQQQADLKAKRFGKRLEAGWNIQTATRLAGYPAVNDAGLNLGYRLAVKAVAGLGLAYKFGLGSWQHRQLTHEGMAMRSFFDWRITDPRAKLFANLWVTAGFEMNYWKRIYDLSNLSSLAWEQSGLVGITRRFKAGRKEAKLQVLWDFVNNQSEGAKLPFVFRYGYTL